MSSVYHDNEENEYIPESKDVNSVHVTNLEGKYTIDEAVEFIGFGTAQIALSFIGRVWGSRIYLVDTESKLNLPHGPQIQVKCIP